MEGQDWGFYLPVVMGIARESTGSYQLGFGTFGVLAGIAFVFIAAAQRHWIQWAAPQDAQIEEMRARLADRERVDAHVDPTAAVRAERDAR